MDTIYSVRIQSLLIRKLRAYAENCGVLDDCIKVKTINWPYEMNISMYADNRNSNYLEETTRNQIQQHFCKLLHVFAKENPQHIEISIEDYINAIKSDRVKFIVNWISEDNLDEIIHYIISTFYKAINNY